MGATVIDLSQIQPMEPVLGREFGSSPWTRMTGDYFTSIRYEEVELEKAEEFWAAKRRSPDDWMQHMKFEGGATILDMSPSMAEQFKCWLRGRDRQLLTEPVPCSKTVTRTAFELARSEEMIRFSLNREVTSEEIAVLEWQVWKKNLLRWVLAAVWESIQKAVGGVWTWMKGA